MESSNKKPTDDAHSISSYTEKHPLLNSVVLEILLKQLNPSIEQLKKFRLVSKVWTDASLELWRKSAVLTLVPDPPFFYKSKYKNGVPVSEFLTEFQDPHSPYYQISGKKAFSKYKLKGFSISLDVCNEPNGAANKFWIAIGPLMKSVHFYRCKFPSPRLYPADTLRQLIVQMIPNLQDLQLTDALNHDPEMSCDPNVNQGYYFSSSRRSPTSSEVPFSNLKTLTVYGNTCSQMRMGELFKVTPNLEVISGIDLPGGPPISAESLVQPIYYLRFSSSICWRHPPLLSNLKTLDLINSSTFLYTYRFNVRYTYALNLATRLDRTQLPLETLTIHLEPFDNERSVYLGGYLKSFSETLKTLHVFRAPVGQRGRPSVIDFLSAVATPMTVLTELHLWGTVAPNFAFLRSTSNLKKLRINLGCFEKRDVVQELVRGRPKPEYMHWSYQKYERDMALHVREDLMEGILCSELEYLEIDFEFKGESWRKLGQWMPNLRRLKCILNEETVPVVCEVWGELTELVCLPGSKVGNSCFVRREEKAGFSGGPGPKLNISDLKDMERFQLDAYCGEGELTDEVVFNGFLKMAGLKCVEICVNSKMSKEAEMALRKSIQYCKVVRNEHNEDIFSHSSQIQ